jgi:transposase InsO family protein
VVLELCTRKVIGWTTSMRIDAKFPCAALKAAFSRRGEPWSVIMHTDRRNVYCGWGHRDLIRRYAVRQHERPWQLLRQCGCRRLFHSLKVKSVGGMPLMALDPLRQALLEYIEVEDNRIRRYSALGYLSPGAFEARVVK